MIAKAGLIGAVLFTSIFTCVGMLGWAGAGDVCTGTSSLGYRSTLLCQFGTTFAALFAGVNFLLLMGIIVILKEQKVKPLIRYLAAVCFVAYGLWMIFSPTGLWLSPLFMQTHYSSEANSNCLDCGVDPTADAP